MVTSIEELPGLLHRVASSIENGREETAYDAAVVVRDEFLEGPPRVGLRRASKLAGRPWGAFVKKDVGGRFLVGYKGPVHWFERGTDPHPITPKGLVGGKKRRGQMVQAGEWRVSNAKVSRGAGVNLSFNGDAPAYVRNHPGMKARPFFGQVKRESASAAAKTLQASTRANVLRAGFGR